MEKNIWAYLSALPHFALFQVDFPYPKGGMEHLSLILLMIVG